MCNTYKQHTNKSNKHTKKMKKEPKEPKIKETKEPKESKMNLQKEPKEPKIKETNEPKEPKVKLQKEPKQPKVKLQKEPKQPKVKLQKEPKQPKVKLQKEPKQPKVKLQKEPKQPKTKFNSADVDAATVTSATDCAPPPPPPPIILKKRGRKPKGGKIISSFTAPFINTSSETNDGDVAHANSNNHVVTKHPFVSSNVILHLKCNYSDLLINNSMSSFTYEPVVEEVESYINCGDLSETAGTFIQAVAGIYTADDINSITEKDGTDIIGTTDCDAIYNNGQHNKNNISASTQPINTMCVPIKSPYITASTTCGSNDINSHNTHNHNHNSDTDVEMKEVWRKINRLKMVLHKDNARFNSTQQSGCFWCTCEFDTPVIHIPKLYTKSTDSYTVYGCFCSPECATSYLMKETIDTSTRFERYQMLNGLYNNICNNTDKPIKPAPDPHYLLSKFYGNLSIDEYRKLLKSDHLLYIVNKPLTHSLPELYEDNNEFLVNNKTTIPNAISKQKKSK